MPTVYLTAPPEAADMLATSLVEHRLAACVNQLACTSTYRWEGDIVQEPEVVLFAKTSADRYDALVEHVCDIHPHDVPCIERIDEADVLDAYAAWRDDETRVRS